MAETRVKIVDEKVVKKYLMDKPSLEILTTDPSLEEIMINAPNVPVYVYHREHGILQTNLVLNEDQIFELITTAASKTGQKIEPSRPFLDAKLADGSRLNATIQPATPEGPTVTIRKFKENPLSIVDLINLGTVTCELAGYLWTFVEGQRNNPMNILVIGGAGSGKTTLLNVLSTFIPNEDRILVIEDTLELIFPGRSNLVRMESRHGTTPQESLTMNDLLINALRMRPDRLVIGEVRGPEAETLFNAMNVGHSAMGTLHANAPSECVTRLTNPPMNVQRSMLPLMDIIVVIAKIRSATSIKRKIISIVEVTKSEVGVSFSEIFRYDPKNQEICRTDIPSMKEEELSKVCGLTLSELRKTKAEKQKMLELMLGRSLSFKETNDTIQKYYADPSSILKIK